MEASRGMQLKCYGSCLRLTSYKNSCSEVNTALHNACEAMCVARNALF